MKPNRQQTWEEFCNTAPADASERLSKRASQLVCRVDDNLNRKIGWLLALEDAIDVAGGAPVQIGDIDTIGQETAGSGEKAAKPSSALFGA